MDNYKDKHLSPEELQEVFQNKVIELLTSIKDGLKTLSYSNHSDEWMDTQQILQKKRISRRTLYYWIHNKIVLCKKTGGKNYYSMNENEDRRQKMKRIK